MCCKNCGVSLIDGADFCPKCGASMADNAQPVQKSSAKGTPKKRSSLPLIISSAAAVVLVAACVVIAVGNKFNYTSGGGTKSAYDNLSQRSSQEAGSKKDSSEGVAVVSNDEVGNTSENLPKIDSFTGNLNDVSPKAGNLIATIEIKDYGTIKAVLFSEIAPIGVENFQKLCDADYYKGLKIHRVIEDFMIQGGSANDDGTGGNALVNGGNFSIETTPNVRHFYGALCYANSGADNNDTQFYIVNNKNPQKLDDIDVEELQSYIEQYNSIAARENAQGEPNVGNYYVAQAEYYQNIVNFISNASDEVKARYKEKGGTPTLDGNYTVFGQVYEGFDVIDAVSAVEVTDNGSGEKSKPVMDIIIKDICVSTFK